MTVFYEKGIKEGVRKLSEEEARHCAQVLRHQSGDEIRIFDGTGGVYRSILQDVSKKVCTFEIIESKITPPKPFGIHLAIAPTKSTDRMEWMTEKLCEIGVDQLTLLETKHSERRKLRLDRLEKKAISAMKQAGNPFKLKIHELVNFNHFVESNTASQKVIAHVDPTHPYLTSCVEAANDVCILVGPEGDFSKEELETAIEKGFQPVSLGKSTLRTETAGLVASCMINTCNSY